MGRAAPYDEVLRPSPSFALEFEFDGRAFLSSLTYPYYQKFYLGEPHRRALASFGGEGTRVRDALRALLAMMGLKVTRQHQELAYRLVRELKEQGLLVAPEDPTSMYGASMAQDYLESRTLPEEVAAWVIRAARIGKGTRVLDLACGTGALTRQLAEVSSRVTGMDVSGSFLRVAREDARRRGIKVQYVQESGNRLVYHGGKYDVVTVSLAFHWLHPWAAAQGIAHVLKPRGRLVLLDGFLDVPRRHPLRPFFKAKQQDRQLRERASFYRRLLAASDSGEGRRWLAGETFSFRELRAIDIPYARAFLSRQHLKEARVRGWQNPEALWARLERRLAGATPAAFEARFRWKGLALRLGSR